MRAEGRAAVPRRRRIAQPLHPDRAVPASRGRSPPLFHCLIGQTSLPPRAATFLSKSRELEATCCFSF